MPTALKGKRPRATGSGAPVALAVPAHGRIYLKRRSTTAVVMRSNLSFEKRPMWTCSTCGERHDDAFTACWRCAAVLDDGGNASSKAAAQADPLRCPRCPAKLAFIGTKKLHEGTRWGVLGDLAELFVNRESFDLYVCPRCGRVEFFVSDIGVQYRPREESSA